MFSKAWIPVKLATGELGHVCVVTEEDMRNDVWFFIPNGQTFAEAYIVHTPDFRVIRSMNPDPEHSFLRHMSLPYKMVYEACFVKPHHLPDDGTQIGERADAAINLLVRYAEELEKRIEELENDLANS